MNNIAKLWYKSGGTVKKYDLMETGKPISVEVKQKRQESREEISNYANNYKNFDFHNNSIVE